MRRMAFGALAGGTAPGGVERFACRAQGVVADEAGGLPCFKVVEAALQQGGRRFAFLELAFSVAQRKVSQSGFEAQSLVQGYVRANSNGTLTVGCYLYDTFARTELTRQGFVVQPSDWRRAAHKCSDSVYARLTGEGAYFDSRIVD